MIYPLVGITDGDTVVISRGRDNNDVLNDVSNCFPRGTSIWVMDSLPINAAELYSKNHDPGWLKRVPNYLIEKKT